MKTPLTPFLAVVLLLLISILFPFPVRAQQSITPDATMQSCVSNDDCTLANTACSTGCQLAPINRQYLATVQNLSQQCGATTETICTTHPPLQAACINARCTIDYTVSGNADSKDYVGNADGRDYSPGMNSGTNSGTNTGTDTGKIAVVPAAPRAQDVPFTALDRSGSFTADNLPAESVERRSLGSLTLRQSQ